MRLPCRLGLLFVTAVVFAPALARAQTGMPCEPYPLIEVNVKPVFGKPALDTSKNLAAIQQMARDARGIIPHYDSATLGVTHYEPVIEFRAPILARQMEDGTYCARVEHLDALLGYRNVTIFIANELTADPCSANHVLGHEQKHVAVNLALLQEFTPLVRDRLMAYFRLYGQFRAPSPEYAEKLLSEKANAILIEMSRNMLDENRRRQRQVDTPEEYAKNNAVCNGWINGLMRRYQISRR